MTRGEGNQVRLDRFPCTCQDSKPECALTVLLAHEAH